MHEPHFWRDLPRGVRGRAPTLRLLLTPPAMLYAWAGKRRLEKGAPADPGLPVICVGNLTLGGAGKTPVSAAVRQRLTAMGLRAATLSRGYGGSLEGPLRVDPASHVARETGDEPLMLARLGESWIARDRLAGAIAMRAAGVQVAIMDDGHQNPSVKKALSLVVIDAAEPFGNRFVFPKGPLREPVARGLSRADGVVLMGDGEEPPELATFAGVVLRAHLAPLSPPPPGRYVAFAGIGRPERFFDSFAAYEDVELADAAPFPDHHVFTQSDLTYLTRLAKDREAQLITTDKDHVRLPASMRDSVARVSVEAKFEDEAALNALLAPVAAKARP
jgi:tetraacyldisaccharide 4'-kinase